MSRRRSSPPCPRRPRDRVAGILQLAEELGARSYTLSSGNSMEAVSQTIIDFAHKNNITKIVAGKPLRPRWQELLRGSLVDQLIHKSGDIDVYIVTSEDKPAFPADEHPLRLHSSLNRYLWSILLVALATTIGFWIGRNFEPTNLVMIYLLAVVVAAIYLGAARPSWLPSWACWPSTSCSSSRTSPSSSPIPSTS